MTAPKIETVFHGHAIGIDSDRVKRQAIERAKAIRGVAFLAYHPWDDEGHPTVVTSAAEPESNSIMLADCRTLDARTHDELAWEEGTK